MTYPLSQNLYPYVLDNPQNILDPTGEVALIEYIKAFDNHLNQAAAALIGYLAGYGITNLEFLGHFLELNSQGVSLESAWEKAVKLTEDNLITIGNYIPIDKPNICDAKVAVYVTPPGTNRITSFRTGFSLPIPGLLPLGALGVSVGISASAFIDAPSGGSICGAQDAISRLRNLQPR